MTTSAIINKKSRWAQAFLIALGVAALCFLPFVIFDGGYFIYYGDFNVQQIPFYKLAHEAVRSGDVFWSWYTDLGANFIGSYSFYLLFSPFFWLTLPFPTAALPFLMAPLLVLKTACAALAAYLYIERFVKDNRWAVVCSLLYAFSGWMLFNVFFNHFHDVAVFFPLLLLGVEKLVTEEKRGFFAAMVALNAMVNYWFFVGEVVFVILYVLVRTTDKAWGMRPKVFARLAFEAVVGAGLAAVVVLPSVLAIMGNPRTGTDELLTGWSFWAYGREQRPWAVIQSLFYPPELPARLNFFTGQGTPWSSLSGWLPALGLTGVLAYFFSRKNDWAKKLLALCLVIALIPGLNSLFILLNHSYYARWFYMPVLVMAMVSARALEDCLRTTAHFRRGIKWSLVFVLLFAVMCGLTPARQEDGSIKIGLSENPALMWVYVAVAITCLLLTAMVVLYLRRSKRFPVWVGASVCLVAAVFGIYFMANGKNSYERSRYVINTAIQGREKISVEVDEPFARADAYECSDNLLMFWHLPNIQTFHSIVPPSVMEFYPTVGVKRDVSSKPEADYYALRPLLSVRWLFIGTGEEVQNPMPYYTWHSEQIGFNVYENDCYLPMGFAYDSYITRSQLEVVNTRFRSNMMLRALVLEDEDHMRHSDIMDQLSVQGPLSFSTEEMLRDVNARKTMTADNFQKDQRGFTSHTSFDSERIVFYSIPWDKGWSATVNGVPAKILRVNVGFMGVRVPPGEVEIRFAYTTPGLLAGGIASGAGLVVLALYLLVTSRRRKAVKKELALGKAQFSGEPVRMSWEEFVSGRKAQQERASHLQRVLNEASRRSMPEKLPQEEQTLPFIVREDANTPQEGAPAQPDSESPSAPPPGLG